MSNQLKFVPNCKRQSLPYSVQPISYRWRDAVAIWRISWPRRVRNGAARWLRRWRRSLCRLQLPGWPRRGYECPDLQHHRGRGSQRSLLIYLHQVHQRKENHYSKVSPPQVSTDLISRGRVSLPRVRLNLFHFAEKAKGERLAHSDSLSTSTVD